MNNKYVRVAASISKITTLVDNTTRMVFDSQELREDSFAALFSLKNKVGHLIFAPANTEVEIPATPVNINKKEKTSSQKLRAVLYVQWDQSDKTIEFEEYYKIRMKQIIERERMVLDAS